MGCGVSTTARAGQAAVSSVQADPEKHAATKQAKPEGKHPKSVKFGDATVVAIIEKNNSARRLSAQNIIQALVQEHQNPGNIVFEDVDDDDDDNDDEVVPVRSDREGGPPSNSNTTASAAVLDKQPKNEQNVGPVETPLLRA